MREKQNKKPTISEHLSLSVLLKGLIVSYVIVVLLFIIFALILTYVEFPESYLPTAVLLATVVSVVAAGSIATRNIRNKGWLNGGIMGLIYTLILYIISSIIYKDFSIDRYGITIMVIGILSGAIGGILGINLRKPSRVKTRI